MEMIERTAIEIEPDGSTWKAWRGDDYVASFEHRYDAERFAASEYLLELARAVVEHFDGTDAPLGMMARAALQKAEPRT